MSFTLMPVHLYYATLHGEMSLDGAQVFARLALPEDYLIGKAGPRDQLPIVM